MASAADNSTFAAAVLTDDADVAVAAAEESSAAAAAETSRPFFASLFSSGVLSVADQGVVSAANFVTNLALGRALLPAELGGYYLAWTFFFFLRGVQEQTLSAPYMVHVHKRDDDQQAVFAGSCLIHQLAFTAAVALAIAATALVASSGLAWPSLGPVAWILLGAAPLMLLREYLRQVAFAHLDVRAALLLDLAVASVQIGGIGLLVAFQAVNAPSALAVLGLACGVGLVGWFVLRPRPFAFDPAAIGDHWRENWTFGKWTLAGQLLGSATPYLLPWVLAVAVGAAETGAYAACATLVGMANLFVVGLSNYLSHRAIHAYRDGDTPALRATLQRIALIYTAALGVFLAAMLLGGETLLHLAYQDRYAGSSAILVVLSAGLLFNSLGITAGNGLWAIERPEANLASDLTALVVTLAAAVPLVGSYGAAGTAWSSCIGMAAGAAVRWATLELLLRELEAGAARP